MMMNDDLDNDLLQYYNDKTIYMSVCITKTDYLCMYVWIWIELNWINNNNKPLLIVVRLLIIIKSAHISSLCVLCIYYAAARFIFCVFLKLMLALKRCTKSRYKVWFVVVERRLKFVLCWLFLRLFFFTNKRSFGVMTLEKSSTPSIV